MSFGVSYLYPKYRKYNPANSKIPKFPGCTIGAVAYPARGPAGSGMQIFMTKKRDRDKIDLEKAKQETKNYLKLKIVFSAMCSIGEPHSVH